MSLDYSLKDIENSDELCFDDTGTMTPLTTAIIFSTMVVGLGSITKENAPKFYRRLHAYERLNGAYIAVPDGPGYITPEQVLQHIGLKVNVGDETDAQFRKRTFDNFDRDAARIFTLALREQEKANDGTYTDERDGVVRDAETDQVIV